jgi:hypothetical protein
MVPPLNRLPLTEATRTSSSVNDYKRGEDRFGIRQEMTVTTGCMRGPCVRDAGDIIGATKNSP